MTLSIVFFLSALFSSCMWAIAYMQQRHLARTLNDQQHTFDGMRNQISVLWAHLIEHKSRTNSSSKIVRNPALNKSSKNTRGAKKDGPHSATLPHKNGNQNSARKSKKVDSKKRGK